MNGQHFLAHSAIVSSKLLKDPHSSCCPRQSMLCDVFTIPALMPPAEYKVLLVLPLARGYAAQPIFPVSAGRAA